MNIENNLFCKNEDEVLERKYDISKLGLPIKRKHILTENNNSEDTIDRTGDREFMIPSTSKVKEAMKSTSTSEKHEHNISAKKFKTDTPELMSYNFSNIRKRKFMAESKQNITEKSSICKRFRRSEQTRNSVKHNTAHGDTYQYKHWLVVAALEARNVNAKVDLICFQTEAEQKDVGKFDDIVLEYKTKNQSTFSFIQAKHILDSTNEKITLGKLLRMPKSTAEKQDPRPFSLEKYFTSYRDKIKINPKFRNKKGEELVANLILATNIDFEENLKKEFVSSENDIPLLEKIKNYVKTETQPMYWKLDKLNWKIKEKIIGELKGTYHLIKLARYLAHCVLGHNAISLSDPLLKPYSKALIENIIDTKENKFYSSFISGKNISCTEVRNLREAFFHEGFLNRRKTVNLFNNYKISRPVELANMIIDKVLKNAKNTNSENTEKSVAIRRDKRIEELYIDELANFVLIEKKGIRFSCKFLAALDDDLPHESIKTFRNILREKLGDNTLTEIKFNIKDFKTCNEMLMDESSFWDGVKCFDKFDFDASYIQAGSSKSLPNESLKSIQDDIKKFFSYLSFAVNYSKKHLTAYCAQQFAERFNLRDNQMLLNRFEAEVNKALDLSEEKYPSNSYEVEELIEKIESNVCKLFLIGCSAEYKNQLNTQGISFREQPKEITSFLQSKTKQVLNFINQHATRLSVLKVYDTFQHLSEYQRDDDYILLKLSTVLSLQDFVFKALKESGVLIIECDHVSGNLSTFWNVLGSALQTTDKKLVLITPNHNFLDEKFKAHFFTDRFDEKLDKNNCITDLTDATQKKLFKKKNILFQENECSLGEIFTDDESKQLICGKELLTLIDNGQLKLGKSVTDAKYDEIKNYFIPRRLYKIELKKEFKSFENEFHIIEGNNTVASDILTDQDIIVISENKEFFQKICDKNKERNVHWIEKKRKYFWQQSQGSVSKLRQFVDKGSVCQINKITGVNNKVVIVAADPGMGKSVFLTHLAVETKKFDATLWIVRINLLDFLKELDQITVMDKVNAFKFIYNAMGFGERILQDPNISFSDNDKKICLRDGVKSLELNLFNHFYAIGKVALLFDGYDEIFPLYKATVINMLKVLKNMNFRQIWLATREYNDIKNEVEDSLSVLSYTLKPFIQSEQIDFLHKFYKPKCKGNQFTRNRAEILIQELPETLGDAKKFMSTPLHAFLVAEVFQDTFKDLNLQTNEEFILTVKQKMKGINILQLYNDFFTIKIKDERLGHNEIHPLERIRLEKEKIEIRENHEKLAIFVLFERKVAEKLLFQNENEKAKVNELIEAVKQGIDKLGIVTCVVEGKPSFIHETFAEFFAATFLWKTFKTIRANELGDFNKKILIENLIMNNKIQICKFFLLCAQADLDGQTCSTVLKMKLRALVQVLIDSETENPEITKQPTKILLGLLGYTGLPELTTQSNYKRYLLLQSCAEMGYEKLVRGLSKSLTSEFLTEYLENSVWELSPLWLAAENGHSNVAQIIAKEFSYNILWKDKHGETLVQRIFEQNNFDVLRTCVISNVLLAQSTSLYSKSQYLPLIVQCFLRNAPEDVIEVLIENAGLYFINVYRYGGKTVAEHIGLNMLKYNIGIAEKLIEKGVEFGNILNPLLHVYKENSLNYENVSVPPKSPTLFDLIQLLLANGAIYNYKDQYCKTTLEIAEQIYNVHELLKCIYNSSKQKKDKPQSIYNIMLRVMIENIADDCKNYKVFIKGDKKFILPFNNNDEPLYDYKIQFPSSFSFVMKANSSIKLKKDDFLCELGLKEMSVNKDLPLLITNIKKSNGFNLLYLAWSNLIKMTHKNLLAFFKSMCKYSTGSKKIYTLLKDLDNLYITLENNNNDRIHKILHKKLNDTRSLTNGKDRELNSLLHLAIRKKNTYVVKLLIEKGANQNTVDKNSKTPLDCAVENSCDDIVELLSNKAANSINANGYLENYSKNTTCLKIVDLVSSQFENNNHKINRDRI